MKSIKTQYIDLMEGRMSQYNFMRSLRMSLPQYITNVTSFKDSVKILKNKGILSEAMGGDPIEATLKSYLAKGYSYAEAIELTAAEQGMDEEVLMSQYPQDAVDTEGYEDEGDDEEFIDMIAKAKEEEAGKYTKFDDFEGGLSEAKEIKGSSSKEQYSKFSEVEKDNLQELTTGINIEHEYFPKKTYEEIEKIVLKNIRKNPNYYTDFKLTGIRDYKPQTMDASKPESHQIKFVSGEDSYVDKERGMKPVKGFEKAKASSNKAKKETNNGVKGVSELTHNAQSVRGLQKFAATGGKMKTIKLKEDYESFLSQKRGEEARAKRVMQATNASGIKFSVNDIVTAPDGKEIKITGFTTGKDGKMKAMYNAGMFADVYNLDDLEKKSSFRPGVDLSKSFDKFKSTLESIVREVINEMYDGGSEDLAAMARSSNALRYKPETQAIAKKAAESANNKEEAASLAVKLAKAKGITDSEQITHIIDLATSKFMNEMYDGRDDMNVKNEY